MKIESTLIKEENGYRVYRIDLIPSDDSEVKVITKYFDSESIEPLDRTISESILKRIEELNPGNHEYDRERVHNAFAYYIKFKT